MLKKLVIAATVLEALLALLLIASVVMALCGVKLNAVAIIIPAAITATLGGAISRTGSKNSNMSPKTSKFTLIIGMVAAVFAIVGSVIWIVKAF